MNGRLERARLRPDRRSAAARSLVEALGCAAAILFMSGCATGGKSARVPRAIPASGGALAASPFRVAVLPFENLAGAAAPMKELRGLLLEQVQSRGVEVLDDPTMAKVMAQQRMRWVGGVSEALGRAFRSQAAVDGILITSLEVLDDADPPKIALFCRLVAADENPRILWAGSVDLVGDQSPGFLGLGLVHDPGVLEQRALESLADGLAASRPGAAGPGSSGVSAIREIREAHRRFGPRGFYRAPEKATAPAPTRRIAVLPFLNDSPRANAGELLARHFVELLAAVEGIEVVEPGVVREALLQTRTIQAGGLSLAQAEVLREVLGVDLVLAGRVMEYQDSRGGGTPVLDFSVQGIDPAKRQVVWTSYSHNRGDDGVFFFDAGRVYTAHALASRMAAAVVKKFMGPPRPEAGRGAEKGGVARAQ